MLGSGKCFSKLLKLEISVMFANFQTRFLLYVSVQMFCATKILLRKQIQLICKCVTRHFTTVKIDAIYAECNQPPLQSTSACSLGEIDRTLNVPRLTDTSQAD